MLLLQSTYANTDQNSYLYSSNQPFESGIYNVPSGAPSTYSFVAPTPETPYVKNELKSYAVRLNYAYKDKYLLTASNRWDGSSVLSKGNQWESFPSVALGWKISKESFLKNSSVISDLKLRASLGYTG
ncbi:SusC/RagA family TonB-linked outer membrane protein, partial [Flavobacterium sp. LBUM151]